jgi:hypothetical protein
MQIRLMADAKVNGLRLPELMRELLRVTSDEDYPGELFCADTEDLYAVSDELLAATC